MYHVYDSKLILPLVVLILWRDASEETPITIDQIYSKLIVYYEPTRTVKHSTVKRTIKSCLSGIAQLLSVIRIWDKDVFADVYSLEDDESFMKLEKIAITVPVNIKSHPYAYYFSNRPCSVLELELVCDSIMSSKGIEYSLAKKLLKVVETMGGPDFKSGFKGVTYKKIPKVDYHSELCKSMPVIRNAIEQSKKITLQYGCKEEVFSLSPYFVVYGFDRYYLICHRYKDITHYRIDRMHNVTISDEPLVEIKEIVDDFSLPSYVMQHPRMMFGDVIEFIAIVDEQMLENMADEFEFYRPYELLENSKVKTYIRSSIGFAVNWFIKCRDVVIDKSTEGGKILIENMRCQAQYVLDHYIA